MPRLAETEHLPNLQRELADFPDHGISKDFDRIYNKGEIEIGNTSKLQTIFEQSARENTIAIIGAMYGDEGKGRIVDNKLAALLETPGIKTVNVIRFQGGNNAGHTLEKADGTRLALHVIPSGVLYTEAVGIIDQGVVTHPEDLITELEYAEGIVGDLRGKVILSEYALVATDLERAEENLNKVKSGGKSNGGTGRGMSPSYAHYYDRSGLKVHDLLDDNWRERLGRQYERYQKEFNSYSLDLATQKVPDFRKEKMEKIHEPRTVGSKAEFLDRLEEARRQLIERSMVENISLLHPKIFHDLSNGVLFEGAQAVGLNAWLGSYPDVTTSDTSAYGILAGTGYWKPEDVRDKIGILKGPYTSSVGKRRLPTQIELHDKDNDLPENATREQERGVYIRNEAQERGTTTGRWRDVAELDLPALSHNAVVGGVNALAVTMMDICRPTDVIRVCTYYTTQNGAPIPFQPKMRDMEQLIPHYIELPGWDGEVCRNAKTLEELPENALKYLAFIQARTGFPIVAVTAGPSRDKLITAPGYSE